MMNREAPKLSPLIICLSLHLQLNLIIYNNGSLRTTRTTSTFGITSAIYSLPGSPRWSCFTFPYSYVTFRCLPLPPLRHWEFFHHLLSAKFIKFQSENSDKSPTIFKYLTYFPFILTIQAHTSHYSRHTK